MLDNASPSLATIRRELKISHDRLMTKLERMINDPHTTPMLQEAIITQRNGRYVIPLRAEFKGQLESIIHDQSSSGATLFVEPLAMVEMNNEWHEMQLAERDEERRILAELSAQVGVQAARAINAMLTALAEFDLVSGVRQIRRGPACQRTALVPIAAKPKADNHPGSSIRLYQARHPLLDPANGGAHRRRPG